MPAQLLTARIPMLSNPIAQSTHLRDKRVARKVREIVVHCRRRSLVDRYRGSGAPLRTQVAILSAPMYRPISRSGPTCKLSLPSCWTSRSRTTTCGIKARLVVTHVATEVSHDSGIRPIPAETHFVERTKESQMTNAVFDRRF